MESSQDETLPTQAFKDKDVLDLVLWLQENGVPQGICDLFESKFLLEMALSYVLVSWFMFLVEDETWLTSLKKSSSTTG